MKIKNRIISFTLALVLLFGCVSTSVFATASAASEEEQIGETMHVHDYTDSTIDNDGDKLCDACVAAQLNANKSGIISPDDLHKYVDSENILLATTIDPDPVSGTQKYKYGFALAADTVNTGYGTLYPVTEDGNTVVYMKGVINETTGKSNYVCLGYTTSGTERVNTVNTFRDENREKSFVITLTVKQMCELTGELPLITTLAFMNGTSLGAIRSILIKAGANGNLMYRNGADGKYVTSDESLLDGFKNISIHVRPDAGDYGLYDIYCGGELVEANVQFFTSTEQTQSTWTLDGTGSNGLQSGDSMKGAQDYVLGRVEIGFWGTTLTGVTSASGNANDDILAIDDAKIYLSENFIEGPHNFKIAGKHAHDLSANEIVETFVCADAGCNRELEIRLSLDTDADGACDTCGLKIKGGIISPDDLKNYINDTGKPNLNDPSSDRVTSTTVSETEQKYGFSNVVDTLSRFVLSKEENGNTYLSLKGKNNTEHKQPAYLASYTSQNSTATLLQKFNGRTQKSFVVSMDVKQHSKLNSGAWIPLMTLASFMAKQADNVTNSSGLKSLQFPLIRATTDGKLAYRDGATNKVVTLDEIDLIKNDFNTVSIHVRPADGDFGLYDIYYNGVIVESDIQFLLESENTSLTWTYTGDAEEGNATHITNGQKVTGAKDYLLGDVRFGFYVNSLNVYSSSDNVDDVILSIDNAKVYFSENYIECASHQFGEVIKHEHDYTNGEFVNTVKCSCGVTGEIRLPFDRNGDNLCDECNEAESGDAIVVARQVLLDELIGLKIFAQISNESWINQNNKAVFTVGDKIEEIPLSEATKSEGLYEFEIKLTSIQMAEDVTLSFVIDGETELVYTTSVKDYAETLITDENQTEKTRVLAKALLNYGAAAQEYFAGRNGNPDTLDDDLANAGLSEADKTVKEYTVDELSGYKFTAIGMTDKVRFLGASFILSSKTHMKVYLTASENATVTVDGKAYAKVQDGDEYYVIVTIPVPAKAADGFGIKITDGDVEATTKVAVHTALEAALTNADIDAGLVKVLNAYVNYCDFAGKYVE